MFSAFAENDLPQVLLYAVLFGLALAKTSQKAPPVVFRVIEQSSQVQFGSPTPARHARPPACVVPTGYSFNLDGATLYLSICLLFLAQALGVHLSVGEQIAAMLVLMLTSRGVD
ncbi:MAG: cation:dicarboxylase symporter family transporter [Pseudonocardia sp.]|nr:cation:dicarboxylase symporter family transporter [Pseudonocardia sp.]